MTFVFCSLASKRRGYCSQTSSDESVKQEGVKKISKTSSTDESTSDDSDDNDEPILALDTVHSMENIPQTKDEETPHPNLQPSVLPMYAVTKSKSRRTLGLTQKKNRPGTKLYAANPPQPLVVEPLNAAEYLLDHAWLPSPWSIRKHDTTVFKFDDTALDDKEKALLDILDDTRSSSQLASFLDVKNRVLTTIVSDDSKVDGENSIQPSIKRSPKNCSRDNSSSSQPMKRHKSSLAISTKFDSISHDRLSSIIPITSRSMVSKSELKTVLHDLEKLKELIELQIRADARDG